MEEKTEKPKKTPDVKKKKKKIHAKHQDAKPSTGKIGPTLTGQR